MPILQQEEDEEEEIARVLRRPQRLQQVPWRNYHSFVVNEEPQEEEYYEPPISRKRVSVRQICTSIVLLLGGVATTCAIWFYLIPIVFKESIVHYPWNFLHFGGESMHLHVALQHQFSYLWFASLVISLKSDSIDRSINNNIPSIHLSVTKDQSSIDLISSRNFVSPSINITSFPPLLSDQETFPAFFYPVYLTKHSNIKIEFSTPHQGAYFFFVISGRDNWNQFMEQWGPMTRKTSLRNLLSLEDLMARDTLFHGQDKPIQTFEFTADKSNMHYFWIQPVTVQETSSSVSNFFVQFSLHYFFYSLPENRIQDCILNITNPSCTVPVPFALPWNVPSYELFLDQEFHSISIEAESTILQMEWSQRYYFTIPLALSPLLCCGLIAAPIFLYNLLCYCCCKKSHRSYGA